jgi:hypothetical protein
MAVVARASAAAVDRVVVLMASVLVSACLVGGCSDQSEPSVRLDVVGFGRLNGHARVPQRG